MSTTGPFTRSFNSTEEMLYREWYRQAAPYKAPLPFKFHYRKNVNPPYGNAASMSYDPFDWNPAFADAYNKAYSKFKDQVGNAASAAVNVAERKQAIDAMAKRVSQLYRFTRALKRFRFGEAAEALGLQVITQTRTTVRVKRTNLSKNTSWNRAVKALDSRKDLDPHAPVSQTAKRRLGPRYRKEDDTWELRFKRRASAFGSNYLEYHFGWEPLMKDIVAAFDLFTDPMRDKAGIQVKGKGTAWAMPTGRNPYSSFSEFTFKSHVSIRARVRIQNLNVYRLEQLGLLNPPVLFWELVPFSFIVDWFVNVGDFLASFSDFAGLELTFGQHVHFQTSTERFYSNQGRYFLLFDALDSVVVVRKVGIGSPTLKTRPLKWPSVTRGLTAISLLTGLFGTVQSRR